MELERITPEQAGIPSQAVLDFLDQLYEEGIEMHAFMLLRHGKVCAEGCWKPYNRQTPHIMFSFSKSLTSTAMGFAVQEGLLSLEDRLVDLFPDKLPEHPSENLQKCQIRHLLMMGCGHETEIPNLGQGDPDWIASFLHHPFVYEPGTHFLYNTAGTNLLAAILAKKTGQTLTQFLKPRLFAPLGMTDIACHPLPDGTEMGGAGMSLTIEDMARFEQFVAQEGRWEGKQLLNREWFAMATSKQIENRGAGWGGDPDWQEGYGFQFWRCAPQGVFRGDGAFGQYGVVFTQQDAVLVIQSASMKLQAVLTAAWDNLLPAFAPQPLPEDPRAFHRLQKRLERLELNPMLSMRSPGAESSLNGAVYLPQEPCPSFPDLVGGTGYLDPEGGSLHALSFSFQGEGGQLLLQESHGPSTLDLGLQGHFVSSQIRGTLFGANGRWRSKNTLEVEVRNTRLAGGRRLLFQFSGQEMLLSGDPTLPEEGGLSGPPMPTIRFRLQQGSVDTKTTMYWEQ